VFAIVGDGGFQMTIQELATAVEQRLPIKIALMNNGYLGMVRQWQELFWEKRYSGVDIHVQPDFPAVVEAYGGAGFRVDTKDQVATTIKKAMKVTDRPALIDFHVLKEENVFPIIPAGQSVDEMMVMKPK